MIKLDITMYKAGLGCIMLSVNRSLIPMLILCSLAFLSGELGHMEQKTGDRLDACTVQLITLYVPMVMRNNC